MGPGSENLRRTPSRNVRAAGLVPAQVLKHREKWLLLFLATSAFHVQQKMSRVATPTWNHSGKRLLGSLVPLSYIVRFQTHHRFLRSEHLG